MRFLEFVDPLPPFSSDRPSAQQSRILSIDDIVNLHDCTLGIPDIGLSGSEMVVVITTPVWHVVCLVTLWRWLICKIVLFSKCKWLKLRICDQPVCLSELKKMAADSSWLSITVIVDGKVAPSIIRYINFTTKTLCNIAPSSPRPAALGSQRN